jgi:hypothetical protein
VNRTVDIVPATMTAPHLDAIADVIGTLAQLPPERTRTREVLDAAIDALGIVTDDVAAAAIDVLAVELADVADRLATRELMLSQALQLAHDQHREIVRLQARVRDLLDLARGSSERSTSFSI